MIVAVVFFGTLITLAVWEICSQLKKIRKLMEHIDSVTSEQLLMEQHRRMGNQ